jgi:putative SOS response-associated peptidase YedK
LGVNSTLAKDPSIGNKLINARAETIGEKPSFRSAFRKRRCLIIVVDGLYELKTEGKKKIPLFFYLKSGEPFGWLDSMNHG